MKQSTPLPPQNRRGNSFRGSSSPLDVTVDGAKKSPATIFWLVIHGLCCLISLLLGFRLSRLLFFLLFSPSSSPLPPSATSFSALQSASKVASSTPLIVNVSTNGGSRVVVGRHGILIRPWPHPDPAEMMKAHRIIERVQIEQRSQYGIKNPRTVIAITPTYVRTFQTLHLTGVMHTLMNLPYDLVWIVVEAGGVTNETAVLISKSGLKIIHTGFDEKIPILWEDRYILESRMRLHGLRLVREKRLDGIVMFADDSNMHSLELFDEIQKVKWIGSVSVGIIVHSVGIEEQQGFSELQSENNEEEEETISEVPVQGPACNSSNHLVGFHTINPLIFPDRQARLIGDRGIVLPRKMEWAGFVLNSRLFWEEEEEVADKSDWLKNFEEASSKTDEYVESPLSLLKDTSVVEPLGDCGRKVMLWWLRVEARADSKFPSRWIIDPPLDITIPTKRTPWPQAPPELPSFTEKSESVTDIVRENRERRLPKRRKRSSRGKKKHTPHN